jgi:hypothetical protein
VCFLAFPAASLPADERLLANLAGYGRDMKGWAEVRDDALHGFVECSDGRLYHPVVAEKALEADGQRKAQKERTRKATDARRGGKRDGDRDEQNSRNAVHDADRGVERNVNRDDVRNEVQQTRPDQTLPEQTGPKPKSSSKPVIVVVPDEKPKSTTTTTDSPKALRVKAGLGGIMGRPLPADWVPDDATIDKVLIDFGMMLADVNAELPTFHALNVQNGTLSQDWASTFYLFAKQWKLRAARAPPRLELSKAPARPFVPMEADFEKAAAFYAKTGRWMREHGPDPMSPACKCPPEILRKHGINPETGERNIPPQKAATA